MVSDGRRDPRQPVSLDIRFKSATIGDFIQRYSRDISRGGIFVKTKSPMPSGTLLKFDIRMAGNETLIQGVGRVVWRRLEDEGDNSPAGMGIKFIKIDEASKANLEMILEGKVEGAEGSGEAPELAQKAARPSSPPQAEHQAEAPVWPQQVPKGAKGTMIGMGPTPAAERSEPAIPGPAEPPGPPPLPQAAPSAGASASLFAGGEASNPFGEADFLADISSAIDSALDSVLIDKPASQPHTTAETRARDEKPAPSPVPEAAVRQPVPFESKQEERISAPPTVVATRAVVERERRGLPATFWVAIVALVGLIVWYFAFRPQVIEENPADVAAVRSKSASHAPKFTALELKSEPEGAKIFINGKVQDGTTPTILEKIAVGKELLIELKLFGYRTGVEKVVPGEKATNLDFKLQPGRIKLSFTSTPEGADLLIDGKKVGKTPYSDERRKGFGPDFAYEFQLEGYESVPGNFMDGNWVEKDGVWAAEIDVALKQAISDEATRKAEEEKLKAEAEQKAQEEKLKAEDAKRKAGEEKRLAAEEEKRLAAEQKRRAEEEKQQAAEEKRRAGEEKRKADEEKRKAEEEQRKEMRAKRKAAATKPEPAPAPAQKPEPAPAPKAEPAPKPAPKPAPAPAPKATPPKQGIDENPF